MASVRMQIFNAIEAKLDNVQLQLDWAKRVTNPRDQLGEDEMNAIVFLHGGELPPGPLTGNAENRIAEFTVGLLAVENGTMTVEEMLDAGIVAVSNALLDPEDRQLGGLAIGVMQGSVTAPEYGRSANSHLIGAEQFVDFTVEYLGREGDAETPGP